VDIITSWGGGPLVREKMIRMRGTNIGVKRLLIYMMVSRDLFDYAQQWAPLPVK
jgi:alginate O-acetyltransferase complex protein AlgJ